LTSAAGSYRAPGFTAVTQAAPPALGIALGRDAVVAVAAGLSVVAVLAVEPLADRLWYARR